MRSSAQDRRVLGNGGSAAVSRRDVTTVLTTRVLTVVATPDLSGVAGDGFVSTSKTRAWQTVDGPARALLSSDETGVEQFRGVSAGRDSPFDRFSTGDTGVVSATRAASTTTGPSPRRRPQPRRGSWPRTNASASLTCIFWAARNGRSRATWGTRDLYLLGHIQQVGGQVVAGSNPVSPTDVYAGERLFSGSAVRVCVPAVP